MIQFNKKKKQVFKKVCLCVFKLLIKYFGKELLDYIVQLLLQDKCLEVNFYRVYLKHAHITKLPDFVRVQQLHSPCAFVEVIFERDAAVPGLDFTAASPQTDVDGFGTGEDFAEGGDVNGLHSDWCQSKVRWDGSSKVLLLQSMVIGR